MDCNVSECAIGALGFYLMARFLMQSGEAESFDFTSIQAQFNIKLLKDSQRLDNTIAVTDQSYESNMKNNCRHLGISKFKTFRAIWSMGWFSSSRIGLK